MSRQGCIVRRRGNQGRDRRRVRTRIHLPRRQHLDKLTASIAGVFMKLGTGFLALPLLLLAAGCGSSTPRSLMSVTASPATADAKDFPNGQVQFTPTGIYNKPPTTVTPQPVTAWLVSPNGVATIDQNGLAQCLPTQVGTATIQVGIAGDGPLRDVAQLICP